MVKNHIMKLILLTLTSLFTLSVYVDQTDCNKPITTLQLNECAAIKRDKAQQIMQKYLDQAIKQAQTAWKRYAKAQCDSDYDLA